MSPSGQPGQVLETQPPAAPEHQETRAAMARRLARLETDLRVVDQHLTPCVFSGMRTREGTGGISVGCPQCGGLLQIGEDRLIPQHGCVVGDWAADLAAEQTQLVAQIEDLKARLAGRRTGHGHRGAAAA